MYVEEISNASVLPARFGWVEHVVSRERKRELHLHDMEVWITTTMDDIVQGTG